MVELILSLILALTGIERTVDPAMTAEAERRAAMLPANFSHDGLTTWEVLAWNEGAADPARSAVEGWRESPSHWDILTRRDLTRIGCAALESGGRWYFVCALAQGTDAPPPPPSLPTPDAERPTTPPVLVLPNTSLSAPVASALMMNLFDVDFTTEFSGAKTSEGDGITAADIEGAAAGCCGNVLGCDGAPAELLHEEAFDGAE